MRAHYDFSTMQGRKNPFAKQLKEQITISLDKETILPDNFVLARLRGTAS